MTTEPDSTVETSPAAGQFEALMSNGEDQKDRLQEVEDDLRKEMENLAAQLKDLVLSQPPEQLLGYLWSHLLLSMAKPTDGEESVPLINLESAQMALEYIHAILSCFDSAPDEAGQLDEGAVNAIIQSTEQLKVAALNYCIASTRPDSEAAFGDETGHVEFKAKSRWIIIRGNRYQVLEEEFFAFVLEPHDDALRRVYGVGAREIAAGIQGIADSMRGGQSSALEDIHRLMESTHELASENGLTLPDAVAKWKEESPEELASAQGSVADLLFGGICNLSRHTTLPETFLEDLSYERGRNTEFFEPGPLCGTPLRTLPSRIKPLVRLDDGFYATDAQFVRDAAYRAIQRGLIGRQPDYREGWNKRQKDLSEAAFTRIFSSQLANAEIFNEVYYRDPAHGNWVENDTLILIEDVMLQIEIKAGVEAMQSPATNFSNHVRAIQNLVVKAYKQTKRFFDYLASAPEVPLYELRDGDYNEVRRVRLADYRLVLPIGLTLESFSPFSAMCKELPDVEPILGNYPFVSMSIDDLFVLNRFLPTAGELFHYLEVRQSVAGIRKANLFDEFDHLGAYILQNRFDITLKEQLAEGADMLTWDMFSEGVDKYFEEDRWLNDPPPCQHYPEEVKSILEALARTDASGTLKADAHIRNMDAETRTQLADGVKSLVPSLYKHAHRSFALGSVPPILFFLCRGNAPNFDAGIQQAEIVSVARNAPEVIVVCVVYQSTEEIERAQSFTVKKPPILRADYPKLLIKAEAMKTRMGESLPEAMQKKLRPNDKCFCGSGKKFKRCHGVR
jgi:hypothetical protein